ncbi:WD40-repeat-containing domain protein [Rhypophila decipiens]|uniref:WD40-repeat-containing domain protein n=1 Tax=Rhypophila decipiens TaxID=261697 RepID=A0AAN6YF02_9PEZI|nr:WD40-repeat-containing domain protein [Rhypophila decipiens]
MASTPMDIDETNSSSGAPALNITRTLTSKVSSVISTFRPTKHFLRDGAKGSRLVPSVLSIDFDDPGELCMTSESDETIQIYNVKEGQHVKSLLSKKYGVKLAKFTHASSSIIYASTKQNDAIRYLATHDNSFIRYFEGHEKSVTALAVHPSNDNFISCSLDGTVRLWNIGTKQWTTKVNVPFPRLAAWDPSGMVFAVACPKTSHVLFFDYRNIEKGPISVCDVLKKCGGALMPRQQFAFSGGNSLQFSNDGKHLLLGSRYQGHFLLDALDGSIKVYLKTPPGSMSGRTAPGESEAGKLESSGDCCFSPDGRYVLGGSNKGLLVWDTLATPGTDKTLEPTLVLEDKRAAEVVSFNPRFNMIATADEELLFWLPDSNL